MFVGHTRMPLVEFALGQASTRQFVMPGPARLNRCAWEGRCEQQARDQPKRFPGRHGCRCTGTQIRGASGGTDRHGRALRRLGRPDAREMDLGQGRTWLARHQLPGWLRVQRVRQERHRLARGAAGGVRQVGRRRARLRTPWLSERPAPRQVHVRQAAHPLPDETRRRAGCRPVGAHQLGPGAGRNRRPLHRYLQRTRRRVDHHGARYADGHEAGFADGPGTLCDHHGQPVAGSLCRCRRPAHRGLSHRRGPAAGRHRRVDFQVESLLRVVCQSGRHTHPGRTLFLGSTLQRHGSGRDIARVHADPRCTPASG